MLMVGQLDQTFFYFEEITLQTSKIINLLILPSEIFRVTLYYKLGSQLSKVEH